MARQKTAIREALTDAEINECLVEVFQSLPAKDQENIQAMIDQLSKIPNMGLKGVLGFLFAVDQAPALDRLNETLNQSLKGG